ncbi:spore germination protein GerPB [Mesobacillus maritimus]|uniref:spore germination protein GerPB n=1 Tax=Mesobacillus maritimus TaxID=1643336 RepID=UPI00203EAB0B|nr:spore germination protein GerPB [Mesobacillus maritimus]MCM3586100.1 spore germination protein GerPB [Mesobacillus maritimus]MCM3667427.1 spore germination protein GerPB [Mesobacillus maritimus]
MTNYYIQQSITINLIKVDGITNSSVLQIGSAGIIKPASYLYNTGGFTGPAPTSGQQTAGGASGGFVVPLHGATR